KAQIKHQLAPIFDEQPTADNTFKALRFLSRLNFPFQRVKEIEITNATQHEQLAIWKATLYDSQNSQSPTLSKPSEQSNDNRTITVFREGEVIVWQNKRALPRTWLVMAAEAVDGEEALRRIRGESSVLFDPTRTALLETTASELPKFDSGVLAADS